MMQPDLQRQAPSPAVRRFAGFARFAAYLNFAVR
jgi:hypothetical protein